MAQNPQAAYPRNMVLPPGATSCQVAVMLQGRHGKTTGITMNTPVRLLPQDCSHFLARPVVMVLVGAFMISFSSVWVALADVAPATSAFYRVFFGSVFLGIAALVTGEIKRIRLSSPAPYLFCGLAFALDLLCWHQSIRGVGPGLATILGNFQVFLMAFCGFMLFGEKLTYRFLVSLPLAICGLLLVVGWNWQALPPGYRAGLLFGLLTAIFYTAYLLLLRKIQARRESSTRFIPLLLVSCFSSLFLGADVLFTSATFRLPTLTAALSLMALGLFSQTVGWILIATAMPKIPASLTGLVLLLQPSLSFLWDVLFFSRPTSATSWLGVTVTLAAIYLGLTGSGRKNGHDDTPSPAQTETSG